MRSTTSPRVASQMLEVQDAQFRWSHFLSRSKTFLTILLRYLKFTWNPEMWPFLKINPRKNQKNCCPNLSCYHREAQWTSTTPDTVGKTHGNSDTPNSGNMLHTKHLASEFEALRTLCAEKDGLLVSRPSTIHAVARHTAGYQDDLPDIAFHTH